VNSDPDCGSVVGKIRCSQRYDQNRAAPSLYANIDDSGVCNAEIPDSFVLFAEK